MGLAVKRVSDSILCTSEYRTTCENWPSKEYGCQTQVQGFLLLRRANLSSQARIAIMTLAGNSLSFSDVRKACKRYADEFLRDPKSQARTASVGSEEQEGDSDVETALAALARESDIDLEETDVQDILLAFKESRQLRGKQLVSRGYRPVTGHTSGGKPYRVEGRLNFKELISRTRCRIYREKGHWARECPNKGKQMLRDSEEVKTSFFCLFRRRSLHTRLHWERCD